MPSKCSVVLLFFVLFVASVSPHSKCIADREKKLPTQRYDVVIVGAGVAGLAAAQRYLEKKLSNFVILEARDRIGGRIHTTSFGGEIVDLGAQYVYAFEGNSLYNMTKDLGRFFAAPERRSDLLSWGGQKLNKAYLNDMTSIIVRMPHHDNSSYAHWLIPKLKRYMESKSISEEDGKLYVDAVRKLFGIHNGADVHQASSWGISRFRESSHGRSKMWQNGFDDFIKVLMGETGNKPNLGLRDKIQLGKEVTGVSWDDSGAVVRCLDGTVYKARSVLVTLPLGVLKEIPDGFFQPPLTKMYKKAIKYLGFGVVDKVFLEFDRDLTRNRNILFAMDSEMKDRFQRNVYTKGKWPVELTGICPTRNSPTLLNTWLVGSMAETMETLSDVELVDGVLAMTRTVLDKQVPRPLSVLRSRWATDKYSRGSYSFRSIETEIHNVSHGILAEAIVNRLNFPVLMFAGEATSEIHYGTVHGALETGWQSAEFLAPYLLTEKV